MSSSEVTSGSHASLRSASRVPRGSELRRCFGRSGIARWQRVGGGGGRRGGTKHVTRIRAHRKAIFFALACWAPEAYRSSVGVDGRNAWTSTSVREDNARGGTGVCKRYRWDGQGSGTTRQDRGPAPCTIHLLAVRSRMSATVGHLETNGEGAQGSEIWSTDYL